jgi:hypothetical protein
MDAGSFVVCMYDRVFICDLVWCGGFIRKPNSPPLHCSMMICVVRELCNPANWQAGTVIVHDIALRKGGVRKAIRLFRSSALADNKI